MASSGTLCRVAHVRTNVSKECITTIIRARGIGELGTLAVTTDACREYVFLCSVRRLLVMANLVPSSPILVTLMMEELSSTETSVLTGATQRNNPEDGIIHSHCCDNLKSYLIYQSWCNILNIYGSRTFIRLPFC
jgi:hypothetical protein